MAFFFELGASPRLYMPDILRSRGFICYLPTKIIHRAISEWSELYSFDVSVSNGKEIRVHTSLRRPRFLLECIRHSTRGLRDERPTSGHLKYASVLFTLIRSNFISSDVCYFFFLLEQWRNLSFAFTSRFLVSRRLLHYRPLKTYWNLNKDERSKYGYER